MDELNKEVPVAEAPAAPAGDANKTPEAAAVEAIKAGLPAAEDAARTPEEEKDVADAATAAVKKLENGGTVAGVVQGLQKAGVESADKVTAAVTAQEEKQAA